MGREFHDEYLIAVKKNSIKLKLLEPNLNNKEEQSKNEGGEDQGFFFSK